MPDHSRSPSAGRPRVAVLLDENTSGDATRYEASKGYFAAVHAAGGAPFGIAYLPDLVPAIVDEFDAFLAVGGRFAYPDEWYAAGTRSNSPPSERLAVERALMTGFLAGDKPVLGVCAGMQMLGCLHGCRMVPDLAAAGARTIEHDRRGALHEVSIVPGTRLSGIVAGGTLQVNSLHREALVEVAPGVTVSARAPDGTIEAIEIDGHRFALGLQWHQEAFAGKAHPGNAVFSAFVQACR